VDKFRTQKGAAPRREAAPIFLVAEQLPRCARVAAILTDAVRSEIVAAAASEAGFVIQRDAMRPFGSPAFAAPVLLHCMADEIVVAVLSWHLLSFFVH